MSASSTDCTAAPETWKVVSGSCEVVAGNALCVTDGSGDSANYGSNENCVIEVLYDTSVSYDGTFDVEGGYYDYLTFSSTGSTRYDNGNKPENVVMAAGETMTWKSDSSGQRSGWTVCAPIPQIPACTSTLNMGDLCLTAQGVTTACGRQRISATVPCTRNARPLRRRRRHRHHLRRRRHHLRRRRHHHPSRRPRCSRRSRLVTLARRAISAS
jgi:hypothetical protein